MRFGMGSKMLNLRYHTVQKARVTFLYMVLQEVYKRRMQVKESLLRKIKNQKIQREIKSMDVSLMDPWIISNNNPKKYGKTCYEEYDSDDEDEVKSYHVVNPARASKFYSQAYLYIRNGGKGKGFDAIIKQINISK